ncbi:mercury resistance system transport protein MerF [Zoogloeaceae bacterium G21618-S1]|nr:mercury resistance system transport protein MerF [Zoogloeaceae bacterium G21618-S1]
MLPDGHPVNRRLVKIGGIGSLITALCCFTPVLEWLAAALGLSAVLGQADRVLLPLLGIFVAVLLVGLLRRRPKA